VPERGLEDVLEIAEAAELVGDAAERRLTRISGEGRRGGGGVDRTEVLEAEMVGRESVVS
jgi:hypothetical protein